MTATAMIHVRVDEDIKARAAETFALMGLSVSDAIRVFLKRVIIEQAMPFNVRVPNTETLAAMAEADEIVSTRRARFVDAQELFDALEKEANKH